MSKPRRLWLIIPWVLFALLAAAWIGYWFIVANTAQERLATWVAGQQARGAEASYARVQARGFPVLLRLEISDFAYAPPGGDWRAQTPRLDLHINLISTSHLIFEAKAPISIGRADGSSSVLTADALLVSVRNNGAALAQASIEADALALDDPAQEGVLRAQKLVISVRPDPRDASAFQVAADATALTLARPVRSFESFGQEIGALRAAIVLEHGTSLMAPSDPLEAWRGADGKARFEALSLHWGALEATGQGEASIDDARRLAGRLELTIPNPSAALAAFAESPSLTSNIRSTVRALSVGYAITGDDVLFDIDARDGMLYIEALPVRELAPLY
jgi:hypothetical protein